VAVLEKEFVMLTSKVTSSSVSSDGETVKLLVQLQDGLSVEAVIMTYAGNSSSDDTHPKSRATVCVSSEVGCQMGCTFCATGTMGLIAELTSGEIVEQLVHARAVKAVRNVVFMGMGEPLNNYNSVADAIRVMIHPQVFALKQRSITVSTVGVIHRLPALARDLPGVSLALSLHAPNQQLRRLIVPSAQAFKLDKLMSAVDAYTSTTGNRVFIEYVPVQPTTLSTSHPLFGSCLTCGTGTCCWAPTSTASTCTRTSWGNCCMVVPSASILSRGILFSALGSTSGRRPQAPRARSRAS
jgi:adenine C2-methylase RlmN of 23S rRNA A2503 and tRNA A37